MIRYFVCSMIVAQAVAYGQSNPPFIPSPRGVISPLEGTFQQVDNGLSRLQISSENLVIGTTLSLPSPSGDGTRFTPQFPQSLVYKPGEDYYWTIGTYNDAQSIFRNVEMRVRLYADNRLLDVTLLLPPDLANGGQTCLVSFDDASPGGEALSRKGGGWDGGGGSGGGWGDGHDGDGNGNGGGNGGDDCDDDGNGGNPENPGTPDQPPQPELPPPEDPHQPQQPPEQPEQPPEQPQQPPEQPQQPPEDPHQPELPPENPNPCNGPVPPQLIYVYRYERI